jgi:serine/threonine protein kinase
MREGSQPGVVALRDTYLNADPPCLEYEYVAGGELTGLIRQWHRSKGGISPKGAAQIIRRLARIVGHFHRLDPPIIHRDLKPANVLVQVHEGGRRGLKVADFGIGALAADRQIARTRGTATRGQLLCSAVRGAYTPLYASPEQVRGEPPDPRDDVHALGVIWYQLLTGDLAGGAPGGRLWETRLDERGMGEKLVGLLSSCFESRRDDRPRDGEVLARQIGALLGPSAPKPRHKTSRSTETVPVPSPGPTEGRGVGPGGQVTGSDHALQPLREALALIQSKSPDENDRNAAQILASRDRVLGRYGPVFSPEQIRDLDHETFLGFLRFENNQHWSGLHRHGNRMTADMPRLREALALLVDERLPLATRLDRLRPLHGQPLVRGLGRAVLTAILQVVYPNKYGIFNTTAEAGLRQVGLWPRGFSAAPFSKQYEAVNSILLQVATALGVDLWTLDTLWWRLMLRGTPRFEAGE